MQHARENAHFGDRFACALPGNCRRVAAHTHTHRAGLGSGCLACWRGTARPALIFIYHSLSRLCGPRTRAPEAGRLYAPLITAARWRRRSAQRPGRAAALQRRKRTICRVLFTDYAIRGVETSDPMMTPPATHAAAAQRRAGLALPALAHRPKPLVRAPRLGAVLRRHARHVARYDAPVRVVAAALVAGPRGRREAIR
eukprot:scaffold15841_cov69-Phaeocystis_antarctica.AAC.2